MKIFEIIAPPPPTPLAIFSFFYPLPVKLKGKLIQQNSADSSSEDTLKPMFSLLDVIIFLFNVLTANKTKYLRRDFFQSQRNLA